MVNIAINFLKNRRVLSEKDYAREQKVLRYSVVSLVIVVVVTMAISIWNFILAQRLSKLNTEVAAANTQMEGYVQANSQQIYLKSRFDLITKFLHDRTTTREALQRVLSVSIPGTHISSILFSGNTMITMQVSSDSVVALRDILSYYQTDTGYFTQVVSYGISRDKKGAYQLSMDLTIPQETK